MALVFFLGEDCLYCYIICVCLDDESFLRISVLKNRLSCEQSFEFLKSRLAFYRPFPSPFVLSKLVNSRAIWVKAGINYL